MIVEGSGTATLAAVMNKKFKFEKGENIVCILSGGNIPLNRLNECFNQSTNFLKQH